MRAVVHAKLSQGRVRTGPFGGDDSYGLNGAFLLISPVSGASLVVMASDGTDDVCQGWEHVSVSLANRCPNWPEMCWIKDLFWPKDETVVQFHPPEADYISNHAYCLHLCRDRRNGHALPPSILVGDKALGDIT